jgi:hypothetical protein
MSHLELLSPKKEESNWGRPRVVVPLEEALAFPCGEGALRHDPRETKGHVYRVTTDAKVPCCGPEDGDQGGCC